MAGNVEWGNGVGYTNEVPELLEELDVINPPVDLTQQIVVSVIDGEVKIEPVGLPMYAAPTLLRIAAKAVERNFGI